MARARHAIRRVRVWSPSADFDRRPDGTIYVHSRQPLGTYPDKLTERLEYWAAAAPHRTFLARRGADGEWQRLTYAETLLRVRNIAQALLNRGLSCERPIAILSGNSLEHGLLALAAMYAGVLYAPLAPAYSLAVKSFGTLETIWRSLRPAMVFASEGDQFEPALRAMPLDGVELVVAASEPDALAFTRFAELETVTATAGVDDAHARVTPDAIAKILFTSGSTGSPKGVINTQRMLCSNLEMIRSCMQFLADEPPVFCDWLPWNHTFGGNHNFGITLYNGGSLYIDEGRPTAAGFETTARNLREIAPTAYFNVPKGFEMLVERLRDDTALRDIFFSKVQVLFYAAAGLSQKVWDELQTLAVAACGSEILMMTGLGATESAPSALFTGIDGAESGLVGLPVPGVELKLAPVGKKLEARVKGPSITPGFWRNEELTRTTFDEEGFYRMGDALVFADPDNPQRGFRFDGRLNEDFKLSTGTWVSAGPLRMKVLAHFGNLVQDVVLAGPDRDYVTALVFPSKGMSPEAFRVRLNELAEMSTGTSTCVRRAVLADRPPSIEDGEITDKGTLNQRAVREHRAALIEDLYQDIPSAHVICADQRD
jgi:feruloyl-CoA synthase